MHDNKKKIHTNKSLKKYIVSTKLIINIYY